MPGSVVIGDVDVSGLTADEAERAVRFRARELRRRKLVVTSPDAPDLRLEATGASLGARVQARAAVDDALAPRSFGGRVLAGVGLVSTRRVELRFMLDENRVDRLVRAAVRGVNTPAADASLAFVDGTLRVKPDRAGHGLDPRVVDERLATLPPSASIPLGPIRPSVTTEEAQRAKRQAEAVLSGPTRVELDGRGVSVDVATKRAAMRFVPTRRRLLVRLNPQRIERALAPAFALRIRESRNAELRPAGDSVKLIPSRRGRSLNGEQIALSMVRRPNAAAVPARFTVTVPDFTTQDARRLRITRRVSTFSTPYACCPPRVSNIQRAAELLDGMIIPAGATFSLNQALGQRTVDRGFVAAPQIAGGRLEDAVGGGVSQLATTFYNAAFFAGLEIVAHTPHSFYISRYPAGREATVSWGGPELVVRNDWPAAVLIAAGAGSGQVTISMYSAPLGRRVETSTGERRDFTEPKERVTINPDLEPGAREVLQGAGGGGFTVGYTRRVYRGDEVKRDETYTWRYVAQDAYIEEGPPLPDDEEDEPAEGEGPGSTAPEDDPETPTDGATSPDTDPLD